MADDSAADSVALSSQETLVSAPSIVAVCYHVEPRSPRFLRQVDIAFREGEHKRSVSPRLDGSLSHPPLTALEADDDADEGVPRAKITIYGASTYRLTSPCARSGCSNAHTGPFVQCVTAEVVTRQYLVTHMGHLREVHAQSPLTHAAEKYGWGHALAKCSGGRRGAGASRACRACS